jgi:hypothetical protein
MAVSLYFSHEESFNVLCHEVLLIDEKYERILSFKQPWVGEE